MKKTNNLVDQIEARYNEDLEYYSSLDDKFASEYRDDIQEAIAVMQRLMQVTSQNNQPERAKELEEKFYEHISTFEMR